MSLNKEDIPALIKWATTNLEPFNVEQISFDVAIEGGHRISFEIKQVPNITSVLSCDLDEVDTFLKQGYIVKELYAKTATLVKREVPHKEQPDPDSIEVILDANSQAYDSSDGKVTGASA
jgi:hypothetical protein